MRVITKKILRRKFFAVRQVVAVPAGQGGVAGVFKKKLQRRRFDVVVAKYHVGFALMTRVTSLGDLRFFTIENEVCEKINPLQLDCSISNYPIATNKPIANSNHFTRTDN